MKQRVISGIFITLAVVLAILSKFFINEVFDIFVAGIAVVASFEVCKMLENIGKRPSKFLSSMFYIALYIVNVISLGNNLSVWRVLLNDVLTLVMYLIIIFAYELIFSKDETKTVVDHLKTTLYSFYVCVYPALILNCLYLINHIESFANNTVKYLSMMTIILIFAVTMLSDTFAFFVGSTLKGPKICPKISPKKTWSGCIGGILGGVIGALIIALIVYKVPALQGVQDYFGNVGVFVLLGVVGSLVSQIGDFFESFLKRKAGIKDSGNLFPGHGGMMDRIDALLFNILFTTIVIVCLL